MCLKINVINIKDGIEFDEKMKKLDADAIGMIIAEWLSAIQDAEKHYLRMIELGATPQIARGVLPISTKTELVITANYREWRSFLKLRTPKNVHPQMLEITRPLLGELKTLLPIIFDDIEVN